MKKLLIAAILTVASCGTAPVTAGLDKDLCEWSTGQTGDATQSEVETQIRADIQNIMTRENTPAKQQAEVTAAISDEGAAINNFFIMFSSVVDRDNILHYPFDL